MPNTVQLKKNGQPVFPVTDVSLVMGLAERPLMDAVYAWDGTGTPDITKIPAGVSVEYNTTTYTGTLAASADTTARFYLVPSTTVPGEYDRYLTDAVSGSYSWKPAGTTAIPTPSIVDNLESTDPTKALSAKQGNVLSQEVSQLEAKLYEFTPISFAWIEGGFWNRSGVLQTNSSSSYTQKTEIPSNAEYLVIEQLEPSTSGRYSLLYADNILLKSWSQEDITLAGNKIVESLSNYRAQYPYATLYVALSKVTSNTITASTSINKFNKLESQVVKHTSQVLTSEQKAQARTNIGAARATVEGEVATLQSDVATLQESVTEAITGGEVEKQLTKIEGSYYDNSGELVENGGAEYTEPYTIGPDVKKIYLRGDFNPDVSTSAYVSLLKMNGGILYRYREAEMAASGGATLDIELYRSYNPGSTFTLQTSSTIACNLQVIEEKYGDIPILQSGVEQLDERVSDLEEGTTKKIECWGDSLTAAGIYEQVIIDNISNDYEVLNCGISGESCYDIGARMGALALFLKNDVTLPANTADVTIGNATDSGLYVVDTLGENKKTTMFKRQAVDADHVNPVIINGVECILSWRGQSPTDQNGTYTLCRKTAASESTTLKAGTNVMPYGIKYLRSPHCSIIWMGTNGGYDITSTEGIRDTLVAELKNALRVNSPANFIIIGLHLADTDYRENLEAIMAAEFGPCYFNLRKYLITYAMADSGLTPTASDEAAIAGGNCPPSLLRDGVHFTDLGYQLIGQQILQRLRDLGIVPESN